MGFSIFFFSTFHSEIWTVFLAIKLSPRLPIPRPGEVLGLVGTNGIGKSTALKVLSGKCKPNLGRFADPPDWQVRIFQEMKKLFNASKSSIYDSF